MVKKNREREIVADKAEALAVGGGVLVEDSSIGFSVGVFNGGCGADDGWITSTRIRENGGIAAD